jgi:hypothetical protein
MYALEWIVPCFPTLINGHVVPAVSLVDVYITLYKTGQEIANESKVARLTFSPM